MCGSGAGIGMVPTQQVPLPIIQVHPLALTASFAGAVGSAVPLTAPSPSGTTATRITSPAASGSAFSAQLCRKDKGQGIDLNLQNRLLLVPRIRM